MLHNGSRISGEPSLKSSGESTGAGACRHELPYPERVVRRIEGSGARDGHVQGSSVCSRWLDGALESALKSARTPSSGGEQKLLISAG